MYSSTISTQVCEKFLKFSYPRVPVTCLTELRVNHRLFSEKDGSISNQFEGVSIKKLHVDSFLLLLEYIKSSKENRKKTINDFLQEKIITPNTSVSINETFEVPPKKRKANSQISNDHEYDPTVCPQSLKLKRKKIDLMEISLKNEDNNMIFQSSTMLNLSNSLINKEQNIQSNQKSNNCEFLISPTSQLMNIEEQIQSIQISDKFESSFNPSSPLLNEKEHIQSNHIINKCETLFSPSSPIMNIKEKIQSIQINDEESSFLNKNCEFVDEIENFSPRNKLTLINSQLFSTNEPTPSTSKQVFLNEPTQSTSQQVFSYEPLPITGNSVPLYKPTHIKNQSFSLYEPLLLKNKPVFSYEPKPFINQSVPSYEPSTSKKQQVPSYEPTPLKNKPIASYEPTPLENKPIALYEPTPLKNKPIALYEPTPLKNKPIALYEPTPLKNKPIALYEQTPLKNKPIALYEPTPLQNKPITSTESTTFTNKPIASNELTTLKNKPISSYKPSVLKNKSITLYEPTPLKNKPIPLYEPTLLKNKPIPFYEPTPLKNKPIPSYEPTPLENKTIPSYEPTPLENKPIPLYEPTPLKNKPIPSYEPTPLQNKPIASTESTIFTNKPEPTYKLPTISCMKNSRNHFVHEMESKNINFNPNVEVRSITDFEKYIPTNIEQNYILNEGKNNSDEMGEKYQLNEEQKEFSQLIIEIMRKRSLMFEVYTIFDNKYLVLFRAPSINLYTSSYILYLIRIIKEFLNKQHTEDFIFEMKQMVKQNNKKKFQILPIKYRKQSLNKVTPSRLQGLINNNHNLLFGSITNQLRGGKIGNVRQNHLAKTLSTTVQGVLSIDRNLKFNQVRCSKKIVGSNVIARSKYGLLCRFPIIHPNAIIFVEIEYVEDECVLRSQQNKLNSSSKYSDNEYTITASSDILHLINGDCDGDRIFIVFLDENCAAAQKIALHCDYNLGIPFGIKPKPNSDVTMGLGLFAKHCYFLVKQTYFVTGLSKQVFKIYNEYTKKAIKLNDKTPTWNMVKDTFPSDQKEIFRMTESGSTRLTKNHVHQMFPDENGNFAEIGFQTFSLTKNPISKRILGNYGNGLNLKDFICYSQATYDQFGQMKSSDLSKQGAAFYSLAFALSPVILASDGLTVYSVKDGRLVTDNVFDFFLFKYQPNDLHLFVSSIIAIMTNQRESFDLDKSFLYKQYIYQKLEILWEQINQLEFQNKIEERNFKKDSNQEMIYKETKQACNDLIYKFIIESIQQNILIE